MLFEISAVYFTVALTVAVWLLTLASSSLSTNEIVPLYSLLSFLSIPVTGTTFLLSIVTLTPPSGISVEYLRLSPDLRNGLTGLITIFIVIGFPGSISPVVLVIVELTTGLKASTVSVKLSLRLLPAPLVYPQAITKPFSSIRFNISSGTLVSVLPCLVGSLSSDICDILPSPSVPAPVIRYPASGFAKYTIYIVSE